MVALSHRQRYALLAVAVLTVCAVVAVTVVFSGGTSGTSSRLGSRPPLQPPDPSNPSLLWVGDVETGDLSQFKDTPWNVSRGGESPEVVSDPRFVREGRYALRVSIPGPSNKGKTCCDPRSEVEPAIDKLQPGDDLYFGFSTLLSDDFPVDKGWQVITQWKGDADGSPPLSINVSRGAFRLEGGAGHPDGPDGFKEEIGPAVPGEWTDFVVHIKFSPDPSEGFVEIWRDGELVLPRFQPNSGTMYPAKAPESYLKVGYYRSSDIGRPGTIYFDAWRVATTRDALS